MAGPGRERWDELVVDSVVGGAWCGWRSGCGLVGLTGMLSGSRVAEFGLARERLRGRVAWLLFAGAIVGLVAAMLPGLAHSHRSSARWLQFASGGLTFSLQPSEFAKLALVVFLAWLFGERGVDPRSFRQAFLPAALSLGVCVLLVGKADFGTAALFALVGGLMLLMAGSRMRHLLVTALLGIVGLAGLLFAEPYRLARITAYRALTDDPLGAGYQPLQSLTTIASGGWFGVGLGSGVQKYGYLPESHSDFIFAVICEETGLLGACVVIALMVTLIWLGLRAMSAAITPFERLLAFGITAVIGWQAVLHIAVVTVVAPTTGISLPLVSAGGSGLLTFCAALGVLAAIASRAGASIRVPKPRVGSESALGTTVVADGGVIRYGAPSREVEVG